MFALVFTGSVQAAEPAAVQSLKALSRSYQSDVSPVVEKFCVDCHTADDASGSVSFEDLESPEALFAAIKTWLKAAQTQQLKQMPPPKRKKQPSNVERKKIIDWVEQLRAALDVAEPFDPGPALARRLNRTQYENTLRDLFGIDHDVAAEVGMPEDPRAFGYDAIASVLDVPESLFEKYVDAAEKILDRAVDIKPAVRTFVAKDFKPKLLGKMPQDKSKDGPPPSATSMEKGAMVLRVNADIPVHVGKVAAGTYKIRVHGWGVKGPNWIQWRPDLLIKVDGQVRRSFPLTHKPEKPGAVEALFDLPAGTPKLALGFANAVHGPRWAENDHRFRRLAVQKIEVVGPVPSSGVEADPEAHNRIFFVDAGAKPRTAAQKIVAVFAKRAFRRPVPTAEVDRLLSVYDKAAKQGLSFEKSVRYSLKAVLLSPHFLFRLESDEAAKARVRTLSDHELAVRLSYFLWGSMPDGRLTELADAGKLSNPAEWDKQVNRLLDDERAMYTLAHDFAYQWLHLEMLERALPSEDNYPKFTAQARAAMRTEVLMFLENMIRENHPVHELIDSDYTYNSRPLTAIYRFGHHGHEFKKVDINKRRHPYRGGLLGMGAIHAMNSHIARNMPTRRGNWILTVMLGDPPPPPPANVEQLDEDGVDKGQAKNFRELLALHADESKTCAGCHKKMDPLGFALDNFNPIGQWETERDGHKIDASAELPDGRKVNGAVELKKILMDDKDRFLWNLTEQMMIFALGRDVGYYDRPSIARIVEQTKQGDYKIRTLVRGIATSYPFRHRRNAGASPLFAVDATR